MCINPFSELPPNVSPMYIPEPIYKPTAVAGNANYNQTRKNKKAGRDSLRIKRGQKGAQLPTSNNSTNSQTGANTNKSGLSLPT